MNGPRVLESRGVLAYLPSWCRVFFLGLGYFMILYFVYQYLWEIPTRQIAADAEKQVITRKEFYELNNSIRQTFVQAVGGAILILGLYFTARTLRISQDSLQTNQEGHITERFTKAIEQLGDTERLTVRLGGIYALERIARDSAKDHWQVMEVLTAYVRDNSLESQQTALKSLKSATDIQAVLDVLGRRVVTVDREKGKLDLYRANLEGMLLTGNFNKIVLVDANLAGAVFQDIHLEEACFVGAHLENSTFIRAHLERTEFSGAHLERAEFRETNFTETKLIGSCLEKAKLLEAYLEKVDLSCAQLQSASLPRAQLIGVCLEKADLSFVNLKEADFTGTQLQEAILTETQLQGANLQKVENLTQAQINEAFVDEYTQLPKGLTKPPLDL